MNCDEVERHRETCPECRESERLWSRLAELPEPEPDPSMRRRFQQALEGAPRRWFHPTLAWAAALILCAALAWTAGRYSEIQTLRGEISGLRSVVALSLLAQQSASERLKGISYAGRLSEGSRDVVRALESALKYDSNVNVRLAASDALRRYSADAHVRQAFVEALGAEESPLVKIALIDTLVEFRERESMETLARIAESGGEYGAVKERAAQALREIQTKGAVWKQ